MHQLLKLERPPAWLASPRHVNESNSSSAVTSAPPPQELQPPPQPPTARLRSCSRHLWQYEYWNFESETLEFAPMAMAMHGRKYVIELEEAYQAYNQGGAETTIITWDQRMKGLQYLARGHTCHNKI